MTRPFLTILALLFLASPSLADPDNRYLLADGEGATGWLELREAGKSLILRRVNRYDVRSTIRVKGERIELVGTLKPSGQKLKGTLRESAGLAGRLRRPAGTARAWKARVIPQGLRLTLLLSSGSRRLRLSGQIALGPRNAANEQVIRSFYTAFQRKDAAAMATSYAPRIQFSDMVFPNLRGEKASSMWAMLCQSEDLVLTFSGIRAGDRYGVAHWEADYELFGNKIHNVIEASFELEDGKIVRHVDWFDFKAWVKQALPSPSRFVRTRTLLGTVRLASAFQLATFRRKQKRKARRQRAARRSPIRHR